MPGSSEQPRVAAIQMSSGDDLQRNLATARELLLTARSRGAGLAVLPENFAFIGARDTDKLAVAEYAGGGPIQEFLSATAALLQMWVVAGSIPLREEGQQLCHGASLVYSPEGRLQGTYRKIHLFDVDVPEQDESYRESASMDAGDEPQSVATPLGRLGLSICYDLRFPELYRRLTDGGATLLSVPAAFTFATGTAHWHVLLRARAIENLAWVVAAGQHGSHPNGRTTFGHSLIVDPWGRIVAEQASGDGVVVADVDLAKQEELRRRFPVLQHRRLR